MNVSVSDSVSGASGSGSDSVHILTSHYCIFTIGSQIIDSKYLYNTVWTYAMSVVAISGSDTAAITTINATITIVIVATTTTATATTTIVTTTVTTDIDTTTTTTTTASTTTVTTTTTATATTGSIISFRFNHSKRLM